MLLEEKSEEIDKPKMHFVNRKLEEYERREYTVDYPREEIIWFSGGTIDAENNVKLFLYATWLTGATDLPDESQKGLHYFIFDYKGVAWSIVLRQIFPYPGEWTLKWKLEYNSILREEELYALAEALKVFAVDGYDSSDAIRHQKNPEYRSMNEKYKVV